jgi:hypothetical protein
MAFVLARDVSEGLGIRLCPRCLSDDIVGDCVDHVGSVLSQRFYCQECLLEWCNQHQFVGYVVKE